MTTHIKESIDSFLANHNSNTKKKPAKAIKHAPILGTFSKGTDGSISINFSVSGGINCNRGCRHHPDSNVPEHLRTEACYAVTIEKRHDRVQLKNKLERHQSMSPAQIMGMAILEYQTKIAYGIDVPWARFSTNGSLPEPQDVKPLFVTQLRTFLMMCRDNGTKVHFPLETQAKSEFYRSIIGDLVVIRESLQNPDDILVFRGACSMVVGEHIKTGKDIRKRRVEYAKQIAKLRYEKTGRKTIVCPAITSGWAKRAKKRDDQIKCGDCPVCSNGDLDVLYPIH